jgi:beta-lactamase regulating signal transducer with metallopeptidase domain
MALRLELQALTLSPDESREAAHLAPATADAPRPLAAIPSGLFGALPRSETGHFEAFDHGTPILRDDSHVRGGRAAIAPLEFATWIWLAGVAIGLSWLIFGHVLLIHERFTALAPPAWLYRLFQRIAATSPGRLPKLVISRRASRPLMWGVVRPTIALPERLCHRSNYEQLRTILLHELAHVRRGDARGSMLFESAFPLFVFHPLYWWIRRQVRLSAELVADDWAARQTGREVYVAQLVALARGTGIRRLSLVLGTSVLTSPSQFYRRMKMLLAREIPLSTRLSKAWRICSAAGALCAVAVAAALVGNNSVAADEPTKPAAVEPAAAPATGTPQQPATDVPATGAPDLPKPDTLPVEPTSVTSAPPEEKSQSGEKHAPPEAPKPVKPAADVPGLSQLPLVGRVFISKSDEASPATIEQLQAERDELRKEVQALKSRLDQLDRASAKVGWDSTTGAKVVQLTHPEKNGQLSVETWTVDANGKPNRIVSKTQVTGDSPITSAAPAKVDGSGHVVTKEFQDKNGNRWVHSYVLTPDGSMGKFVESHLAEKSDVPAGVELKLEPSQPPAVSKPLPATEKAPYPDAPAPSVFAPRAGGAYPPAQYGAAGSSASVVSTRPLDLVALATSYADAIGAVELAKANLAEAEQTRTDQGQARQLMAYRAGLDSAVRKERLLRRIAEVAVAGTQQEYERAAKLHATGAVAAEEMEEVRARLEILKHILKANDSDTKPAAP